MPKPSPLPVLRSYSGHHLDQIALPLGGIGTGTISLNGRGGLQDFECMNRPAKGYTPDHCFFALRVKSAKGIQTRLLQGPLPDHLLNGPMGASSTPQHNLPRFAVARFDAAYPFATIHLSDPLIPLKVRLEAYNPLTPPDVADSALPVAVLRYVLTNPTSKPISASIAGSLKNFIGADGSDPKFGWGRIPSHAHHYHSNRNTLKTSPHLTGLLLHSEKLPPTAETFGTLALAVIPPKSAKISHRTAWAERSWGDSLLDFWDDFSSDGHLDDRPPPTDQPAEQGPVASLCVSLTIPPKSSVAIPFLITWHFPNRITWTGTDVVPASPPGGRTVGNHYTTRFSDAWHAATSIAPRLPDLESRTRSFVSAFLSSSLPDIVQEAALFNLSALRSQTCFQTADGNFYGFEGCHPAEGCCPGSCTHVWNYEAALPQLFASLARNQRSLEFNHATDTRGVSSFRINLPLAFAQTYSKAAADGQMGCIIRLYREYRASGNLPFLQSLYPAMKRSLSFAWIPNGWDADRDGLMEGCQHNTMDVEYFGPNPQMQALYLAALLAAHHMATAVNDAPFAAECHRIYTLGSPATDKLLFNGDYYEHKIIPPGNNPVDPALTVGMGAKNLAEPELQLGAGCLIDQLFGQYLAHQAALGHILNPKHITSALRSIHTHNFKPSLRTHFNHMRTYATGDEPGTLMCSFPKGRRPKRPFPYYNECMTGFEYTAAVGMIQEGLTKQGLELIAAVRARHTGHRRNPFDEPECGHHYARSLAAWAAIPALSGTDYNGLTQTLTLRPKQKAATLFFATGDAWGIAKLTPTSATLTLGAGSLPLRHLTLHNRVINLTPTGTPRMLLPRKSLEICVAGEASTFKQS